MKNLIYPVLFAILLFLGSCSNEDVIQEPQQKEVGKLSFGSILNDFTNQSLTKASNGAYDIPHCSEEAPLFVYVSLKVFNGTEWTWYKNSNEQKIKVEVNPNGSDLDGDGVNDAWFTQESADLELEEGRYSIEYFAVASADDPATIIYMAPRIPDEGLDYNQDVQYHNFVNSPLPIEVVIPAGAKYYQPIEVLCYEEHYAFAFGYLFFDFQKTDLIYLCTYGNVCDEDGRHIPAQFKMKVWKDANETELLVVAQNERKTFSDETGTHYYADALCFPLPVIGENDEYHAKIWLVEGTTETLIRQGSFNADDLSEIYNLEQEHYYYHFRESCCGAADNFGLLDDITANEEECEEEPQDPECVVCDNNEGGKIKEITVKYLGDTTEDLVVSHNGPDSPYQIFDGEVNAGQEILLQGKATTGGNPVPSVWTEMEFTVAGTTYNLHTSCSQPLYPGQIFGNGLFEVVSARNVFDENICRIE